MKRRLSVTQLELGKELANVSTECSNSVIISKSKGWRFLVVLAGWIRTWMFLFFSAKSAGWHPALSINRTDRPFAFSLWFKDPRTSCKMPHPGNSVHWNNAHKVEYIYYLHSSISMWICPVCLMTNQWSLYLDKQKLLSGENPQGNVHSNQLYINTNMAVAGCSIVVWPKSVCVKHAASRGVWGPEIFLNVTFETILSPFR